MFVSLNGERGDCKHGAQDVFYFGGAARCSEDWQDEGSEYMVG